MTRNHSSTILDLSDFIISKLRMGSGLWYELNEGLWQRQYINQANITDGTSFLALYFSVLQPRFDQWISLDHELGRFYLAWQNRYDSRKIFEEKLLRSVAQNALYDCFATGESRYRLLSFLLTGASTIDIVPVRELIMSLYPQAVFHSMPEYNGKLCDNSDFVMSIDPSALWFQLMFESPIENSKATAGLSQMIKGECHCLDTNSSFESSSSLQQHGVDRLLVFGRKW